MTNWSAYQDDISDANDGARAVVRWLNENKPLAAPAPEGGAVWFGVTGAADETDALAVALFDVRCPGVRMTDEDLHYYRAAAQRAMQAVTDELDTPALATREEAPAEAGGEREDVAEIIDPVAFDDGPVHPQHLSGRRKLALAKADAILALLALRAQPQAREDAQPVAWLLENHGSGTGPICRDHPGEWPNTTVYPLFKHPAPDALRTALVSVTMAVQLGEAHDIALAALQAEQKGGA